jgi:hydrogenase maturation protease
MRTLVLGLGNPLLGDDAIGLRVAAAVRERLAARDDVEVQQEEAGGIRLMELLTGFERAILVDAIVSGGPFGAVRRMSSGELPTQRTAIAHGVDLPRALELGRALGLPMPAVVRVVAIEAESVLEFREDMTPAVAAALEPAVRAVLAELGAPS